MIQDHDVRAHDVQVLEMITRTDSFRESISVIRCELCN